MRFTFILAGLAFASGALSNPSEKRSITECAFEDPAAKPLLPTGTFISSEQEAIFQRLLGGISLDIKSIEQRCTGKQRRTVRRCRKYWEKLASCVTAPEKLGQEHYRARAMRAVQSRKKTKENGIIKDASYNLIHQNLQLVGFINELHGHEEVPQYLTDRPAEIIDQIVHDLQIDVTKPLPHEPKKPLMKGGR